MKEKWVKPLPVMPTTFFLILKMLSHLVLKKIRVKKLLMYLKMETGETPFDVFESTTWKPPMLMAILSTLSKRPENTSIPETPYAYGDIIDLVKEAGEHIDTFMIPKVKYARDVLWVETLLKQLEIDLGIKNRIGIEILIEEVEAMMNVDEIAFSSERLEAMIFGMGDYSASQGIDIGAIGGTVDYPGDIWHYPRYKMIIAAKAAGIDPIDGPFGNYKDDAGFRIECKRAQLLGCAGKWAIHPAQVQPALEIFSPEQETVDMARKLAVAYAEAEAQGIGAISVDGTLVDAASVRIQQNIVDRADLIGM